MHIDKKVGIALDLIGFAVLLISSLVKLKIFWPIFGMACMLAGTYKLITRIFSEYSGSKNLSGNGPGLEREIASLAEENGFGRIMQLASDLWQKKSDAEGGARRGCCDWSACWDDSPVRLPGSAQM